jgi:FMN reductase
MRPGNEQAPRGWQNRADRERERRGGRPGVVGCFRLENVSGMMNVLVVVPCGEEIWLMTKRFLIVLGSVTPPGRMHRTVNEAAQRASDGGVATVEVLDLASVRTGFAGAPPVDGDETADVVARLGSADAVLFASPVYRGSFTGVLKNLLDVVPVEALEGKPAGIMAMGNTRDHALGVERHLRDVLAWFGVIHAPTAVFLSAADFEAGAPTAGAAAELDALIATLALLADATSAVGRVLPLRPPSTREG